MSFKGPVKTGWQQMSYVCEGTFQRFAVWNIIENILSYFVKNSYGFQLFLSEIFLSLYSQSLWTTSQRSLCPLGPIFNPKIYTIEKH